MIRQGKTDIAPAPEEWHTHQIFIPEVSSLQKLSCPTPTPDSLADSRADHESQTHNVVIANWIMLW